MTTNKEDLQRLKLANDAYSRGTPFLTEEEYHNLWRKVRADDPDNPELYHTARDPNVSSSTRPHLFTIMGTQKAFEADDLRPFFHRFKDEGLILQPKYDGLAAMVYNTNNQDKPLIVLYGDGKRGRDISHHAPAIKLPVGQLAENQYISVEILIPRTKWDSSWGKNPRNVASGWINRDDALPKGILEAIPHEIGPLEQMLYPPHDLQTLPELFLSVYQEWRQIYPLDGLMLKVVRPEIRAVAGHNGTVNLWSVAWKPPMQLAWTTVTEVEWNISRTGRVIPTVKYHPVELCETTNTSVTGNNADWITSRRIAPGVNILVGKAGEIIPKIIKVDSSNLPDHVTDLTPYRCPVCGEYLDKKGVDLICTSDTCLGQLHKKLYHFCDENGMYIRNIGTNMLEKILKDKQVYEVLKDRPWALLEPDTFGLERKLRQIWGDATTENFYDGLEEIQGQRDPAHFIGALGFPGLGYKQAIKCFRYMRAEPIKGRIHRQAADSFARGFVQFKQALDELKHFRFAELPAPPRVTYCITGALSVTRNEMIQWLGGYGWQFVNTVTRYTNYLIVGETNKETVKQKRAKNLDVTLVYEHQIPQLLKEQDNGGDNKTDS